MSEPTGPGALRVEDPGPATPDTADWTWVLRQPCPDCGFDPSRLEPTAVPALLRDAAGRFTAALGRPDARTRPGQGVWSPVEYACHVRDVCDVMAGRLEQILDGGGQVVRFADWDQDATALAKEYWRTDGDVLRGELHDAFEAAAATFQRPVGDEWGWPALRSNGSEFTAGTLAVYFAHDIRHHLWDVKA
jgi:hypothetical protein